MTEEKAKVETLEEFVKSYPCLPSTEPFFITEDFDWSGYIEFAQAVALRERVKVLEEVERKKVLFMGRVVVFISEIDQLVAEAKEGR